MDDPLVERTRRLFDCFSRRDVSVELLGRRLPAPVLLAPIGVQGMLHPEAELAVARAARSLGVPLILSTVSSTPASYLLGWTAPAVMRRFR